MCKIGLNFSPILLLFGSFLIFVETLTFYILMKRLSLLFVAMLLATISFAQVKKSPAPERYGWDQEYPLYGEVKSVTISHYEYVSKFGKNEKGELKDRETYFFNSAGDVEQYVKDGEYGLKYCYNTDGVEIHKYSFGELVTYTANKYDENGRVVESAVYDSAGALQTMTFNEYDSEDNHIREIVYDSSGTVTAITCYGYDEQGNCTSIEMYDSYDSLAQEETIIWIHQSFTYDSAGNIAECLISSGSVHSVCLFHYDANGNLVEMECRNSLYDSLEYKEILSYDESGDNLKSIITYEPRFDGRMMVPISITEYNIVYVGEEAEFTFADFDEEELVAEVDDEQVFVNVERMPSFMGGDFNTFRQWFCTEFKYPAIAVENGIQGRVVVKFVIEKDGKLTNIEFLQSPDPIFNDEVIRVLKMSPKWTPGYQGDKPVRVSYVFTIRLNLN